MPSYTYPGVYVQEIPSGLHTITGVSTSTAAFIDFFKEGTSNQAVQITSLADFNRIFGGLDTRSEASYAINQFFLNGGTQAYIVRVAKNDTTNNNPFRKAQVNILSATASGTQILLVTAANEGAWGNCVRVDIEDQNNTTAGANPRFNLYVTRYDGPGKTAKPMVIETYLDLSMLKADSRYAVDVVNQASKLIQLTRPTALADTTSTVPCRTGFMSGDLSALVQADFDGIGGSGTFNIKMDPAESTVKTVTLVWAANAIKDLTALRNQLEIAIRGADPTNASPAYTGARVDLISTGTARYLRILSGKRGDKYDPAANITITAGATNNKATVLKFDAAAGGVSNVQEYCLGATVAVKAQDVVAGSAGVGSDGAKPGVADIIGQMAAEPYTGMYALEHADLFNILSIPRTADLTATEMTVVVSTALKYCEDKRAFMIIDIPSSVNDVQKMKDWMSANDNLRHKNAALYFPRLEMPDPLNDYRPRDVGASGTMAGLYSRTDSNRGVWKAAAGTEATVLGLSGLGANLTDLQTGILNPLGINCFRIFPVYGMVSWGGRTLDGSDQAGSEWKYIPVRRLALFLEESLFRGTKWVVFEPNDEPLWAQIRMNLGAFMMSLFRQGAFQGTTPDKAFYIKCDSETTTQDDRNHGIVNIEVGFAPLKPAEFVVLKFQQIIQKD